MPVGVISRNCGGLSVQFNRTLPAEDFGLKAGLHFESRLYHATFALADHSEGFDAFLQKREPQWAHK